MYLSHSAKKLLQSTQNRHLLPVKIKLIASQDDDEPSDQNEQTNIAMHDSSRPIITERFGFCGSSAGSILITLQTMLDDGI